MPKYTFEGANNTITITLDGDSADISAGGSGQGGNLRLKDEDDKETTFIASGQISFRTPDGKQRFFVGNVGFLHLGGNGAGGEIVLHPRSSAAGMSGQLPTPTIRLLGDTAGVLVGGNGTNGDILLFDASGNHRTKTSATIRLDGQAGDIHLKNADCAEEFDVSMQEGVGAGTVMVLDDDGRLRRSEEPYDRRVAGVISGAGGYRPGIVLDRKEARTGRLPLALVGKVFCQVDAQYSPVEVGDLLTTSPTPGHAMKACEPLRAFGAVIGKALCPLRSGAGLIPILVALQ